MNESEVISNLALNLRTALYHRISLDTDEESVRIARLLWHPQLMSESGYKHCNVSDNTIVVSRESLVK